MEFVPWKKVTGVASIGSVALWCCPHANIFIECRQGPKTYKLTAYSPRHSPKKKLPSILNVSDRDLLDFVILELIRALSRRPDYDTRLGDAQSHDMIEHYWNLCWQTVIAELNAIGGKYGTDSAKVSKPVYFLKRRHILKRFGHGTLEGA